MKGCKRREGANRDCGVEFGRIVLPLIAILLSLGIELGCARLPKAEPNHVGNKRSTKPDLPVPDLTKVSKTTNSIGTNIAARLVSLTPTFGKTASHDRIWKPEYALLPTVDFDGWKVTLRNVRNSRYRTEENSDIRYYDMTFALTDVKTIDFIVVPFQSTDLLAHTMLSFGLADNRQFVVSVEARLQQGQFYSPTGGAADNFELMYVVGDERDLIPLRTRVRQVDCYIYRGKANPEDAQRMLVDIISRINAIAKTPEFYNTITNNCTTNLVDHVNRVYPNRIPYNWKVLLPGRSDQLAFDLNLLDIDSKNFSIVKPQYRINTAANLYEGDSDFSIRIRDSIPHLKR